MKRLISLALTLLLLTSLPAHAATWFDDGEKLHRDPFCVDSIFSFDSYYTVSSTFSTEDEARAHGPLCESCTALVTPVEGADAPVIWYFNPNGGEFYHRDENCTSVNARYTPMSGQITAERPDWMPENACYFCGRPEEVLRSPSDTRGWNASVEDKAKLLPGVWTLPSENAISFTSAAEIANAHLSTILPKEVYTLSTMHYNQGGPDEARETWKVAVTTVLRHPVCIVYIDALTGDVYHTQMADEFK